MVNQTERPAISCYPTKETIASCNHCGESSYQRVEKDGVTTYLQTGLQLFELKMPMGWRGQQASVWMLCAPCLKGVNDAIFPHRTGI